MQCKQGENVKRCIDRCQNWFVKFRYGNFNLEDSPRPGRPLEADVEKIKSLVVENPRITTREIAKRLNLSNASQAHETSRINFQA